jgi:hypothetical protein
VVEASQPPDGRDEAGSLARALTFNMQRCAYYHGMRARFFDAVGKIMSLFTLIAGAGAFTTLLQGNQLAITILASITAFFSGLNLIVGFARKARDHEVLRGKYYAMKVDVAKAGGDVNKLREIEWRLISSYADGTIFMSALDMIAHNRACLSQDPSAELTEVPRLHRVLAHVWSFTGYYASHVKTHCAPDAGDATKVR